MLFKAVAGVQAKLLRGLVTFLGRFPGILVTIAMLYKKVDFPIVWSGFHHWKSHRRLTKNRLEIMSRTNSSHEQCSSGFLDQPEKFSLFFPKCVQNLCTQLQVFRKLWGNPDLEQTGGGKSSFPPQFCVLTNPSFKDLNPNPNGKLWCTEHFNRVTSMFVKLS